MSLTPEERHRIYLEEKARIEAEARMEAQMSKSGAPIEPEPSVKLWSIEEGGDVRKRRFKAEKISPSSWLVFVVVAMSLLFFVILPGANYLAGWALRAFPDGAPRTAASRGPSAADATRQQYEKLSAHYDAGKYADAIDDFTNFDEKSPLYAKAVAIRNQAEEHIVPLFIKAVTAGNLPEASTLKDYLKSEDLSDASRAKFEKALVRYQAQREAADKAEAQAAEARAAAEQLSQRKAYAPILEELYLRSYRDVHVSVEGPDSTTLHITYVLMSRPLVYNMSNDTTIVDGWRRMGFRKVIFDDGYDHSWVITL